MSLLVGASVREVPVPPDSAMGGFVARTQPSTGIHDPTTVRVVVLDDVAVVTVDVCVLHEQTCRDIERAVGLGTVVVAAVHTHSGPAIGLGRAGGHESAIHDAVVDAAVAGVREARQKRRSVEISWASVRGLGVAKARRHLDRTIDPPLDALRFSDATTGEVVATITCYPCHPVVLDATNTMISADYVDALRRGVEDETGAPCLALTGAAGDVNTGHAPTASFSTSPASQRTFGRAQELGTRLAHGLRVAAWTGLKAKGAMARSLPVVLDYEPITQPYVDSRRSKWEERLANAANGEDVVLTSWIDWARHWQPEQLAAPWQGRVVCIDLGEAALVTLPGEPFLSLAESLKDAAPLLMVAGYCDGVPGYLPTSDAYPEGGYEVEDACMYYAMPAPFKRGSAEELLRLGTSLIRERDAD
ncbi:MAG: neutral/alkaline non-lysosomal ceramidase N-terminal domain-containing protein [Actinobacteria bacterium]|nr:neutral/alkaline non-lysosomal ceramidase N-terminal domain-containing protein [Actinomycetota bacterium]